MIDEHLGAARDCRTVNVRAGLAALDTANVRWDSAAQGWVVSGYAHPMNECSSPTGMTIRPAGPGDADGITRIYMESAHYHASLDPGRYGIPDAEFIKARYREGRQHPPDRSREAITLIAEMNNEIAGFVDARLSRSPDPMHREMLYCHIVEIAISNQHQGKGLGAQLLRAAEDWGRERGADLASLEYLAANQRAQLFYEQLGYGTGSIIAIKWL